MGMAASQARFLQLTARKNNDEYMGQQINQSRTALANKSAGLFEKMLALQPPTPPSSMDDKYYTQGYSFTDPRDSVRKKIVWTDMASADPTATTSVTVPAYYNAAGTKVSGATVSASIATDLSAIPLSAISGLISPAPDGTVTTVVKYASFEHTAYDPEGNYKIYTEKTPIVGYFDNEQRLLNFQELTVNANGYAASGADAYNPGSAGTPSTGSVNGVAITPGAAPTADNVVYSATAATSPITLSYAQANDGTGYNQKDLSYNGNFDSVQFQQDMDKYEFDKNTYDYQIERINLETKQIQEQDKSMELKLKQIDTDHSAIQTEMEAVSKVITKNIESTFKTFA